MKISGVCVKVFPPEHFLDSLLVLWPKTFMNRIYLQLNMCAEGQDRRGEGCNY